ncbi:hypothetical protein SDC9_136930 [bioreactor metagenome]|uniref:Uncharacterized protein n=1 Tax=bioreactor metagenome TaxID=1076179 RepID=A0A645DKL8_9ZZZZ
MRDAHADKLCAGAGSDGRIRNRSALREYTDVAFVDRGARDIRVAGGVCPRRRGADIDAEECHADVGRANIRRCPAFSGVGIEVEYAVVHVENGFYRKRAVGVRQIDAQVLHKRILHAVEFRGDHARRDGDRSEIDNRRGLPRQRVYVAGSRNRAVRARAGEVDRAAGADGGPGLAILRRIHRVRKERHPVAR